MVAVNALFIRGAGALAAVSFGLVLVLLRVVFCLSGSALPSVRLSAFALLLSVSIRVS